MEPHEVFMVPFLATFVVVWGYNYIDERHGLSDRGTWTAFGLVVLTCLTVCFGMALGGAEGWVYAFPFVCALLTSIVAGFTAGPTVAALGKHLSSKERERLTRNKERTDPAWVQKYVRKKIIGCHDLFQSEVMPQHLSGLLAKVEGLAQNLPVYFQLLRTPMSSAPSAPATISGVHAEVERSTKSLERKNKEGEALLREMSRVMNRVPDAIREGLAHGDESLGSATTLLEALLKNAEYVIPKSYLGFEPLETVAQATVMERVEVETDDEVIARELARARGRQGVPQ